MKNLIKTPKDVAAMMALLKVAGSVTGGRNDG